MSTHLISCPSAFNFASCVNWIGKKNFSESWLFVRCAAKRLTPFSCMWMWFLFIQGKQKGGGGIQWENLRPEWNTRRYRSPILMTQVAVLMHIAAGVALERNDNLIIAVLSGI
jgi:hypothetical protein